MGHFFRGIIGFVYRLKYGWILPELAQNRTNNSLMQILNVLLITAWKSSIVFKQHFFSSISNSLFQPS